MTTRVGYVGVDHHHRDPYFAIAAGLDVEVVAVCEPGREIDSADVTPLEDRPDEITTAGDDPAAVARGTETYSDPETLLAETDVDVVWITYRNDETPAIVESAIEAGVHVLSEKPIARTAADLEPVATKANCRGVTVSPTTFYRRNPVAMDLRGRVGEGFFGDVWSIEGRFVGSQLAYRDTSHYVYDREASRGGALQWIGPHWLDAMPWILDDPIAAVDARFNDAVECDVDAGAVLQFETESGTLGTFQTGYYLDDRGKDAHLGIYGEDAQARTPMHHDSLQHSPTVPLELTSGHEDWSGAPRRTVEYEFGYDRFPAWGDYVKDFFADFFSGYETGDVPATVEDALRLLRVLDAAYESADSGEWVTVGTA